MLETCNLHTILSLPQKVFTAGVKTIVLFFKKGTPTKKIFYYDLNLDRNLGLTNPLTENDLKEFVNLYNTKKEGLNSRKIIKTINNLLSANQAINFYKNKALYKHTSFLSKNKCLINKKIFSDEASEIIFKSFSDILSLVSGTYYPPRSKKVLSLINRIKSNNFTKSTLGGCIVEKKNNFILITKELRIKKMSYQLGK